MHPAAHGSTPGWTTGTFSDSGCPLPLDVPFTAPRRDAWASRVRPFARCCAQGWSGGAARRLRRGQAPDDTLMRARALGLVLPPDAVVTDRTAAWLHGVDVLPRSRSTTPRRWTSSTSPTPGCVDPESTAGRAGSSRATSPRSRRPGHHGAADRARPRRLLWRFDALAAIDGFLRLGVPHDLLIARDRPVPGLPRRPPAALPGAARRWPSRVAGRVSPPAALVRRRPARPELQIWVYADDGVPIYRLDIADPELRYAAEYDGEEFHTERRGPEHDEDRRELARRRARTGRSTRSPRTTSTRATRPVPRLQAGSCRGASQRRCGRRTAGMTRRSARSAYSATRIARSAYLRAYAETARSAKLQGACGGLVEEPGACSRR